MKLGTHLTFNGRCEEAFKFYEKCLGGTLGTLLTYGDSPMAAQVPPEWRGKIVHAALRVGNVDLTGVERLAKDYEAPKGFYVLLGVDTPAQTERIFHLLAEKGVIRMPLQETFWSVRFGIVVDQFGIPWEINCEAAP
jgi:PhnB protein